MIRSGFHILLSFLWLVHFGNAWANSSANCANSLVEYDLFSPVVRVVRLLDGESYPTPALVELQTGTLAVYKRFFEPPFVSENKFIPLLPPNQLLIPDVPAKLIANRLGSTPYREWAAFNLLRLWQSNVILPTILREGIHPGSMQVYLSNATHGFFGNNGKIKFGWSGEKENEEISKLIPRTRLVEIQLIRYLLSASDDSLLVPTDGIAVIIDFEQAFCPGNGIWKSHIQLEVGFEIAKHPFTRRVLATSDEEVKSRLRGLIANLSIKGVLYRIEQLRHAVGQMEQTQNAKIMIGNWNPGLYNTQAGREQ